jgi:hypothetical protein
LLRCDPGCDDPGCVLNKIQHGLKEVDAGLGIDSEQLKREIEQR